MSAPRNYHTFHMKGCCRCHEQSRASGQSYCRRCKAAYMRAYRADDFQPRQKKLSPFGKILAGLNDEAIAVARGDAALARVTIYYGGDAR